MGEITSKTLLNLYSNDRSVMESAFNCIYNKYASLVYYVSFEILKSNEDAEDIVNETFLKMYSSRKELKEYQSVKYFLLAISKNLSINLYNKKILTCSLDVEIPSNDMPFDELLEFKNKYKDVLTEEELSIVMDHLLCDFKFKEIAMIKNTTTDSISGKYRRALEKLKKFYKE